MLGDRNRIQLEWRLLVLWNCDSEYWAKIEMEIRSVLTGDVKPVDENGRYLQRLVRELVILIQNVSSVWSLRLGFTSELYTNSDPS